MSAFGLKPTFKNYSEYQQWKAGWKLLYREVSHTIRRKKIELKYAQRVNAENVGELQKALIQERAMGAKAMTLLSEAKIRWENIKAIKKGIQEQFSQYPLVVEDAKNIEFHFNKKHLEFPDIVPMWVVKAKGKTYYVNHVDCNTAWTTRENPDHPSTKGSIRIKRGTIQIDSNGNAVIS
jgi:hypothetical protein